jgi:hypothetical protein
MGFEQFPHFGLSAARATSILFQVPQNWQRSVALVEAPAFARVSSVVASIVAPFELLAFAI